MIHVKFCGITRVQDAETAVSLGANLIGLNFWPGSKRYVQPAQAISIAEAVRGDIETVGIFVDAEPEAIRETAEAVGLSYAQLHGTESEETLVALEDLPIIQAFGIRDAASVEAVVAHLDRCRQRGREPEVLLFDTHDPSQPGGTGRTFRWDLLQGRTWSRPVLLAGGLTARNVAEAVRAVEPWGVDVAGGVESGPGVKDPEKMAAFVRATRGETDTPKGVSK